jgi:TP901 family phage tail tape measure protein
MAEDNVQANIRIGIDTSDALVSIKNLQRQISAFHTSMANGSAANAAAASSFQKTLIDNINATKKFSASIQTVRTTTETFTNSLEKNKLSLSQYFRYAGGASKSFGRLFTTEFDTINKVARERVKDLQTQYIRMGRDASGAMKAIAVRPLMLDMDSLATKTAIAAQRQQLLNQLLKQGSTNLLNFGKNTQWAGRQLMVGFTIPLSIFGATAAKSFMTIEEQAIRFRRVYGDLMTDPGQTEGMLDSIKELASEFTKYGVAVDKTLGLAASAAAQGKTGADLTAQVAEATRLSVLGQVEQQQALDTTISVTNAFGVAAEDLATKIDFLNAVENQTVTSIEDLTIAIPKAGPVIKQLGGGVEDLAFFLTAMKEGGINASEGANALKSGLASLINPTEKASSMLAGFGININGIVESNKGDVKGIVIDFAAALDKLDPLGRARAIEQLFGKFQFSRLSTLFQNVIGEGTQAQRVLDLAATSSEGLAELSARELGKVSESSMFKFKKSIEDIKVALAPIGETFLKLATPVIEFGTKVLNAFNSLDERTKGFVAGLVGVVGGIGPILLMTFGLLANGVANIIKGFTFVKSVFNGASVSSNDLGSQISYMTAEQIKAASVAASLDQVHGKLTQTFTSEANAIGMYVSALQRANTAAAAFNVPAVGRARPSVKMAKGGMVRGPGGPTDDLVPTDLSNGEAVIDAATVKKNPRIINALFAGKKINIPGYAENNSQLFSGMSRAHLTMPSRQGTDLFDQGVKLAGIESFASKFGEFVKVVSNLVADLPQKLNIKLDKGTASIEEFQSGYFGRSGKLNTSAELGGANLKDSGVSTALLEIEDEIGNRVVELAKGTESQKVSDELVAKATREVIDKYKNLSSNIGSAAKSLDVASKQVGQVRVAMPNSRVREGLASGELTKNELGHIYAGDVQVGRESQSVKNSGKLRPASAYNPANSYAKQTIQSVETGSVNGIEDFTEQASPSKKAYRAGENIGKGAIQGIESTVDDAQRVGRKNRRVTANPDGQGGLVIQPQASQSSNFAATPASKTPRRAIREADLQARQRAEQAATAAVVANTDVVKASTKTFGLGLRNASYAVSGLSGVALMFGQSMGNLTNVIFGASLALSALTTAAEINASTGFLKLGPAAAGAKGIGGFFSRMVSIGGKAVMTLGRFAGVIGIAITAISGFVMLIKYVNDQREKERLKIEGLGDAATLTAKQLTTLGNIYGKPKVATAFESVGATAGAVSSEERATAVSLSSNEDFKKDFEQTINTLKTATRDQAIATFETLSMTLFAQGYEKEIVQQIINTIKVQAGKTKLDFQVESIDITQKGGKVAFKKTVDDLVKDFQAEADKPGSRVEIKPIAVGGGRRYGNLDKPTKPNIRNSPELMAKLDVAASNLSERMNAVQTMFNSGTISLDDYNIAMGELSNAMTKGKDSALLSEAVFKNFTAALPEGELKNLMPTVAGTGNEFLVMKASMTGTITTADDLAKTLTALSIITDYLDGNKKGYSYTDFAEAQKVIAALQAEIDKTSKKQEELNKETEDYGKDTGSGESVFQKAVKDMAARTKEIQNQINAFRKLKAAGYDTEKAFSLAKDPILAAALASTKVGTKEWKLLVALIKESESAAAKFKRVQAETLEGATEEFDAAYGKVSETFSALEEGLQVAFDKANKVDKDLISNAQSQIAALEYTLDDLNAALDDIQLQEDAINEKYDKRLDALDKIQSANEAIARQQKSQLTIADALSQGDISAAAKAIQDARAEEATTSFETQKRLLENARASEIGGLSSGGKTKAQINAEVLSLQKQIKIIEEQSLEPAQRRVELAEEKLQKDIANLTVLNKTKSEWDLISSNIRIAKTQTDEFVTALKAAEEAARNLNAVLAARTTGRVDSSGVGTSASGFALSTSLPGVSGSNSQFGPNTPWARAVAAMGMSNGGMVPKYFAAGGFARGTDTVPAMLTPGEFVVKKYAVENFGTDRLKAINSGSYSGESVYNNYELNVNVRSDANPSEIARVVISQIKQVDSQRARGIRL